MERYTVQQACLVYGAMMRQRFDAAEEQARLVWAIMNGWKRPNVKTLDEAEADLRARGTLVDGG